MAEPFWLESYCGGRWRKIGRLVDVTPEMLRAARLPLSYETKLLYALPTILYRVQKRWLDFYSYTTDSVGLDSLAFDEATSQYGVVVVVTYAVQERLLNLAPARTHVFEANFGQGLQRRAPLSRTTTISDAEALAVPETKRVVRVQASAPQPTLPY